MNDNENKIDEELMKVAGESTGDGITKKEEIGEGPGYGMNDGYSENYKPGDPKIDREADYDPVPDKQKAVDSGTEHPEVRTYDTARSPQTQKGIVSKEDLTQFM